jgi:hypothetical protein
MFKVFYNSQALVVVIKAAEVLHKFIQRLFTAVAEWPVAQIVGQAYRLGQILIGSQSASDRASGGCDSNRPR